MIEQEIGNVSNDVSVKENKVDDNVCNEFFTDTDTVKLHTKEPKRNFIKPCLDSDVMLNGNGPVLDVKIYEPDTSDASRLINNENGDSEFLTLSNSQLKKIQKIQKALLVSDIECLNAAAISEGGLITDSVRQKVWPKLFGLDMYETSPRPTKEEVEGHPYYQQVLLDVNRSLKRFPPSIKEKQRLTMQDQLVLLIMRVLIKHPSLHYYQGYHDICVTFLLVLGEELSFHVVDRLSIAHLGEFMKESMEPTSVMLNYMYPILQKERPQLCKFLEESNVGVMFALSWLITWFSHVLNNYSDVVRLFDFFIVSTEWMPVYLSTAIVLHREAEILEQECEISSVHSLLLNIPDDLPFEKLIKKSIELYKCYPPVSLKASVMKRLEEEQAKYQVRRPKNDPGFVYSICKTVWHILPERKLPIVLAAVMLAFALYYQAYKT